LNREGAKDAKKLEEGRHYVLLAACAGGRDYLMLFTQAKVISGKTMVSG
jgi:hypothetical protein